MAHIKKLPLFVKCVIQNFPFIEEDFDALTNYELLCKVVEFLNKVITSQNEVIGVANNLQDAFQQLHDYVENYFDNLDVQEEINNKLDAMVEDGTLQEIITAYIQANVAWTFDTVADMKAATNLVNGSYAKTLGFYTKNDGGGALYNITNTGIANEHDIIAVGSLFAHIAPDTIVTPEQYGAYGDGTHDDTTAWQKAVDSNRNILAKAVTYLCGKIEVSTNTCIDCNHAKFICTDDILFDVRGTVNTTLAEQTDYSDSQQNYAIATEAYATYTGFAVLKGDNNFEKSRDYYKGGFVCEFKDGKMNGSFPIPVTNPSIELITPITGEIKNIDGLTHTSYSGDTASINIVYGLGYRISNISEKQDSGYKFINLSYCLNCICDNVNVNKKYGSTGTVSYIVVIDDSSYCKVLNSVLHNEQWHAVTTGGRYLCYGNTISDCYLTSRDSYAFLDHANARGTTIEDSTVQCLTITALGTVDNVELIANNDTYKRCLLRLSLPSEENNAIFNVKNVNLHLTSTTSAAYGGVQIVSSSETGGKTFYCSRLTIDNVYSTGRDIGLRTDCASDCTSVIKEVNVNNSGLDIALKNNTQTYIDTTNAELNLTNCLKGNVTRHINFGGDTYVFNVVNVVNTHLWRFGGTYTTVNFNGVDFDTAPGNTAVITNLYGSNIKSNIGTQCLVLTSKIMISDMNHAANDKWFNICNDSTKKYYTHLSGGDMVTVELTA